MFWENMDYNKLLQRRVKSQDYMNAVTKFWIHRNREFPSPAEELLLYPVESVTLPSLNQTVKQ